MKKVPVWEGLVEGDKIIVGRDLTCIQQIKAVWNSYIRKKYISIHGIELAKTG